MWNSGGPKELCIRWGVQIPHWKHTVLSTIPSGPDVRISPHAVNHCSDWPAAQAVECHIKFSHWKVPLVMHPFIKWFDRLFSFCRISGVLADCMLSDVQRNCKSILPWYEASQLLLPLLPFYAYKTGPPVLAFTPSWKVENFLEAKFYCPHASLTATRHRASTSTYSLTFRVRVKHPRSMNEMERSMQQARQCYRRRGETVFASMRSACGVQGAWRITAGLCHAFP